MHKVDCYFVSYIRDNYYCHAYVYGDFHKPIYESELNDIIKQLKKKDTVDNIVIFNLIEMKVGKPK